MISLLDRIKETSHSTGTGAFALDGAAPGFGAFGSAYSYNDILYYGISDGVDFEVGSGQYFLNGSTNSLRRWTFSSSQSNANVNWGAGTKEVFATYPGKTAVYSASGVNGIPGPQASGIAYWQSPNVIGYDNNLVWDSGRDRLGIMNAGPSYSLDVGGAPDSSAIRASGMIVGTSGVMFSGIPSYSGGRQLEPYIRNQLDSVTGTNAVFALSGVQDQRFQFVKQAAGTVFMGPVSGACDPQSSCPQAYPTFRQLTLTDLPAFPYIQQFSTGVAGAVAFYKSDKIAQYDTNFIWDEVGHRLGVNNGSPQHTLDVGGNAYIYGDLTVSQGGLLVTNTSIFLSDVFAPSISGNIAIGDNAVSGYYVQTRNSNVIIESTTGRILSNTDFGHYIQTTNAAAVTIAIPTGLTPAMPFADFMFEQWGAGQITVTGNAGVTIRASRSSFSSYGPHSVMTLKCTSQDVYTLYGDRA